jgi:hypothetical protein
MPSPVQDALADAQDPAPRVIRMIAEALATNPELREVASLLRKQALILEGATFRGEDGPRLACERWYVAAAQRRRVEKRVQLGAHRALMRVRKDAPRLTEEDVRERERMREAGLIGPPTDGTETVEVKAEIR